MTLLHISINADASEGVAKFLAQIMGSAAMLLPPFPYRWIAFAEQDDGTAIEVYPTNQVLEPGTEQISCDIRQSDAKPTIVHAAICATLNHLEVISLAEKRGWLAQICNRGPFECVEV